jgi:hypothetical protein
MVVIMSDTLRIQYDCNTREIIISLDKNAGEGKGVSLGKKAKSKNVAKENKLRASLRRSEKVVKVLR